MCRKPSKHGRRTARMYKGLTAELQHSRMCMESGSTDGLPKKNTETLLQCVGLVLGKTKLIWEMKPDREGKVTRKDFCR